MRSGLSPEDYLRVVAQKKPRLQALVDQAPQLTQEAIDALSEPLWVRQALTTLRTTGGKTQKDRVAEIVQRVIDAEEAAKLIPPQTYEVRIWDGLEQYVGSNRGDRDWKIQVQPGDSLLIIDEQRVRFADSVVDVGEFDRYALMLNSKLVGYMNLNQYRGFHRALINQRHKNI